MRETAGHLPNALAAVLFDMDGSLVQTEELCGEAMFALATPPRRPDVVRGPGSAPSAPALRTSMTILLRGPRCCLAASAQLRADARWVEDRAGRPARGRRRVAARRPGAGRRGTRCGLRSALVTTTPRRLAELVLRSSGEISPACPSFDVTVCGDRVPARKPDPAPYRQAMAALDIRGGVVCVIEDSQSGIASGLAAGAAVLGVPAVQAVTPAPGLVLRESLVGVGVAGLAAVLGARVDDLTAVDR